MKDENVHKVCVEQGHIEVPKNKMSDIRHAMARSTGKTQAEFDNLGGKHF